MKKILVLIFLFGLSFAVYSQTLIIGGAGNCVVNGDPNNVSALQTQDVRYECLRVYSDSTKSWYKYVDSLALGSRWVVDSGAEVDSSTYVTISALLDTLQVFRDTLIVAQLNNRPGHKISNTPPTPDSIWIDSTGRSLFKLYPVKRYVKQRWVNYAYYDAVTNTFRTNEPLVVLGLGQSNMEGITANGDIAKDPDSLVVDFSAGSWGWRNAQFNNPLFQYAKQVAKRENRHVRFINVSDGGQSISYFYPDSTGWNALQAAAAAAGLSAQNNFDEILWLQGEKDRDNVGINVGFTGAEADSNYLANLYVLIDTLRSLDFIEDNSLFTAIGLYQGSVTGTEQRNEALSTLRQDLDMTTLYVPSDNLYSTDLVHYSGGSVDTLGERTYFYVRGYSETDLGTGAVGDTAIWEDAGSYAFRESNVLVGENFAAPTARITTRGIGNTNATTNLLLRNLSGINMLTVLDDGKTGIGVTPTELLHLYSASDANMLFESNNNTAIKAFSYNATPAVKLVLGAALGTKASPTFLTSGQALGRITFEGYRASDNSFQAAAAIGAFAAQDFSGSAIGTYLRFETTQNGFVARSEKMRLLGEGILLIGTTTSVGSTYKLQTAGATYQTGNLVYNGALMPNGVFGPNGYFLTGAGAGAPNTWTDPSTLFTNYWGRTGNYTYPATITDSIAIGTTTPDTDLHLNGDFKIEHSVGTATIFHNDSLAFFGEDGTPLQIQDSGGLTYAQFDPFNGDFQTYTTQIHNGSTWKNALRKTAANSSLQLGSTTAGDWSAIYLTHKIGIENNDPQEQLSINDNTSGAVYAHFTNTTTGTTTNDGAKIGLSASEVLTINQIENSSIDIATNNTIQVTIEADGDVIIYNDIIVNNANNVRIVTGSGSPEGVVTAGIGSTYHRIIDGGAGTSFYVKESGTGNTGWVAK